MGRSVTLRMPRLTSWRQAGAVALALVIVATVTMPAGAAAVWQLQPDADTFVAPGGTLQYQVVAKNVGDEPTSGEYRMTVSLPAGISALSDSSLDWSCTGDGPGAPPNIAGASVVTCVSSSDVFPGFAGSTSPVVLVTSVDGGVSGPVTADIEIAGGGALQLNGDACGQAPAFDAPACAEAGERTIVTTAAPVFGVDAFDGQVTADPLGNPFTQAGGHPFALSTQIDLNTETHHAFGQLYPVEPAKSIIVDLPPGLVGNPTALGQCTMEQLAPIPDEVQHPFPVCPSDSQVGVASIRAAFGRAGSPPFTTPALVYNMVPPPNAPARFGINIFGVIIALDATLRSGGDYGVTVNVRNVSEGLALFGTTLTFWGFPADPSHDAQRWCPEMPGFGCSSSGENEPFFRLPTSCPAPGVGLVTGLRTDSWEHPGDFKTGSFVSHLAPGYPLAPQDWGVPQGPTGCDQLRFDPTLTATPASPQKTGKPSGFTFDLHMSQADDPNTGLAPADLKKAVVTLPAGTRVSPSAADGLQACSSAQIALSSDASPTCPDASKIGSLTIDTPLLDDQLTGAIYLAKPHDNPSNTLLGLYLVAEGHGVVVKLPGRVDADPVTGQLTTTFDNNPQLPFEHLHLQLDDGPRAPLVTPAKCGTYTTHAVMTSWGGQQAVSDSEFTLSHDGKGAPCPAPGFDPDFTAGTTNPRAGAHSSFVLSLSRDDDEQELSSVSVTMPPGLVAKLKGVPLCPEAQAAAGTCSEQSRVGSVSAGAGAGPNPFFLPGRAYLGGPYKGAPFNLSIVVPAVAGPFDLGTVVVRSAIHVDRRTTVLRIASDPLPTILQGIPLQTRVVRVDVDRPKFMINPTSCSPKQIRGAIESTSGTVAQVSERFQVGGCGERPLRPKMHLKVGAKGRTGVGATTPLTTKLVQTPGQTNLKSVSVTLPLTMNARLPVVENACTIAEFDAGDCESARAGSAVAVTPLLDRPLRGGVYFVKTPKKGALPNLVVALRGQVDVDVVGKVRIPSDGRLGTSFDTIPDVPITSFTLRLVAGKKGPVGVAENLCTRKGRKATASIVYKGQNGDVRRLHQPLEIAGCGGRKKGGSGRR